MEPTDRKPWWRRLRVRISVRALIVLVLIAGGGLGWLAHSARIQREAVAAIEKAGGRVSYNWKFAPDPFVYDPRPLCPKWLADAVCVDYFARVVEVYSGTDFTDEGMAAVERLPHVEAFSLSISSISEEDGPSDAGLARLRKLPCLRRLTFYRFRDKAGDNLAFLRGLAQLEDLEIDAGPVSLKAMDDIATLAQLKHLGLSISNLTDTKLASLKGLRELRSLRLPDIRHRVTVAGLVHLGELTRLESLEIEGMRVTSLEPIRGLTGLKLLDLTDTSINEEGLSAVAGFTRLEGLALAGTLVGDDGLAHIRDLSNLTHLELMRTFISDAGLAQLVGLTRLQALGLSNTSIGDAGVASLLGFPSLDELKLVNTRLTDAGLKQIAGMKSLTKLGVNGSKVTPGGVAAAERGGLKIYR